MDPRERCSTAVVATVGLPGRTRLQRPAMDRRVPQMRCCRGRPSSPRRRVTAWRCCRGSGAAFGGGRGLCQRSLGSASTTGLGTLPSEPRKQREAFTQQQQEEEEAAAHVNSTVAAFLPLLTFGAFLST